jgi:hypothetical protein
MEVLLSRYVDGELSPEERAGVHEHLLSCGTCQRTLGLFQKNESLLSNALAGEAFGDAVVDAVSRRLRQDKAPAEAKPDEDFPGEWLRPKRLVPLAAAALLLSAFLYVLISGTARETQFQALIRDLRERQGRTEGAFRDQLRQDQEQQEALQRLVRDIRTREAFRNAGDGLTMGYVESQAHVVIKASFDSRAYSSYSVFRRGESEREDQYVELAKTLALPEYTDSTARRGQGYYYKFRAFRSGAESADSAPIYMRLPFAGELAPEESVLVACDKVAVPRTGAWFVLQRVVNGKLAVDRAWVNVGERVGSVRDVAGIGQVDFSTNLVLDRIEEGNQAMTISYTAPILDEAGRQVMQNVEGGRPVPAVTQREELLNVRSNLRTAFRPASAAPGISGGHLWEGSSMRVRAYRP